MRAWNEAGGMGCLVGGPFGPVLRLRMHVDIRKKNQSLDRQTTNNSIEINEDYGNT